MVLGQRFNSISSPETVRYYFNITKRKPVVGYRVILKKAN
jgi:hypothetical protein